MSSPHPGRRLGEGVFYEFALCDVPVSHLSNFLQASLVQTGVRPEQPVSVQQYKTDILLFQATLQLPENYPTDQHIGHIHHPK